MVDFVFKIFYSSFLMISFTFNLAKIIKNDLCISQSEDLRNWGCKIQTVLCNSNIDQCVKIFVIISSIRYTDLKIHVLINTGLNSI